MNRIIAILPSLALYGLGLASFFFLDIYISSNYDQEFVSQWAFYKSSIFILGGFCILGFDQVMVRVPKLHFFIKKKFVFQSLLISILGTSLVWFFYPLQNVWLFFVTLNLFSMVIFLSGIFRANQKFTIAQLATNGWKIVIVAAFFLIVEKNMLNLLAMSLGLIFIILILLYVKNYSKAPSGDEILKYDTYRKTGIAFFLHNMTLTSAVYGEQFIINLYGNEYISSELFMYFAYFSPIILSANGFIGFIIGPKLRARKTVTTADYRSLQLKLVLFAVVMALISFAVGIFLLDQFKGTPFAEVNIPLAITVLACCMIRTVYTASSLYLGVFGSNAFLYKTAGLNWAVLITYISLILVGLISNIAVDTLIIVIAILTTLHWLSRLIISHSYAVNVFKDEKH
ncbi:hypothetical protein KORDIASMS9_01190 [Kordia sp. SMS9]|uniref:hypothetical protein n=1 Tax=Kordia sp. SMS9 TaxID=2282170 RepID=UPI000E0D860A|nr:hypothetical protein [Kordia sp. SMS9]AXG68971.1 hypothetical protein KORDIASMS9_01190 [Kordia sp. SMS9]